MAQSRLSALLAQDRPLLFDGGMGTMLQQAGMPAGISPERFCLERPDILLDVHRAYIAAGADIIIRPWPRLRDRPRTRLAALCALLQT